jgi:carboxyl-terminal processing protease
MQTNIKSTLVLLAFLGIAVATQSCQEKEEPIKEEEQPISPNIEVNKWIKEVMDEVYLWLSEMRNPIANDAAPEDYFEALLNRPADRFSAIYPDYQALINSLQGVNKEAGYEFSLARESNENENVLAFVTYIKRNSPAAAAGIKRGDIIFQINGTQMTISNFRSLIGVIDQPHSVTSLRYDEASLRYIPQPAVNLTPVELAENPNFLDTIYTIDNQKIGYVVYHFFAPGIDGDPRRYDTEMDQIFGRFKAQGINHLILDLRYNGGGFASSATNLASLIAPNVTQNDVFSRTRFNSFLMGFPQLSDVKSNFSAKPENLGNTLSGNRVYIITSRRTASASELIINGLKPFMDVFLVGDRTVGKNVGSIAIEDEENPKNKYGLLPIISRSYNRDNQSEYAEGFAPNLPANELTQLNWRQFGDTNEYLLRLTLGQISTNLPQPRFNFVERIDVGSSIEDQTRFGKLIEDQIKMR